MLREAYVAKQRTNSIREGNYKQLGGATADTTHAQLCLQETASSVRHPMSNQMFDLLEGYLEKISAAETLAVANGGPLSELSAGLAISVDTVEPWDDETSLFGFF